MKTENLTFLEAVHAMERGECYHDLKLSPLTAVHRIKNGALEYYCRDEEAWIPTAYVNGGGSIVPDPSKPKKKASEEAWERMVEAWKVWKGDIYAVDMDEHARGFYRAIIDCAKCEMREEMEGK